MCIITGLKIHFSNRAGEPFKGVSGKVGRSFSISCANSLQGQLEHLRRVIKGKEARVIDGLDGTRSLAVIRAVPASAESQRPIFLVSC